jgi:hypothetical protein
VSAVGDLWLPVGSVTAGTSWRSVGRPYTTGADILGEVTDRTARQQLWQHIPVQHAITLLAGMMRDVDLQDPSLEAAEAGWASQLDEPARTRAVNAVRSGRRLLPPQLLLLALLEALRFCPPGVSRADLSDLDLVLQAVWSIGDELGQTRDGDPEWGGLPAKLAAEMMANGYFNVTARPLPLIARTDAMWCHGWTPSVKPALQARAGGSPAQLYAEAAGCELDCCWPSARRWSAPGNESADWTTDRPHLLTLGMACYTKSGVIGRPSLGTAAKGKAHMASLGQCFQNTYTLLTE